MRCGALIALALFALPALGAVDTAAKRASVVNMAGHALPIPAGGVTDSDRAHLAMTYAGLEAEEPPPPVQVEVPYVVGEADSSAAETLLVAEGLLLGNVTEACSSRADNEVAAQNPEAGSLVDEGTEVDLIVSNGVACAAGKSGQRIGIRIGIGL
jgi:hypothetical protein